MIAGQELGYTAQGCRFSALITGKQLPDITTLLSLDLADLPCCPRLKSAGLQITLKLEPVTNSCSHALTPFPRLNSLAGDADFDRADEGSQRCGSRHGSLDRGQDL